MNCDITGQNKPCGLMTAICYWLQTTESISQNKSCLKLIFVMMITNLSPACSHDQSNPIFFVNRVMSAQRFKRKSTNLMPVPQNQIKCFHGKHWNERAAWTCPSVRAKTRCAEVKICQVIVQMKMHVIICLFTEIHCKWINVLSLQTRFVNLV